MIKTDMRRHGRAKLDWNTAFVVDDDPEQCLELADYLRGKGFVVHEFGGATAASAQLREHKPALVMMDVNMPSGDGIRATETILSLLPETTVVLISGFAKQVVRASTESTGALTVLQKPLHLQELAAVVSGIRRSAPSQRHLKPGR